MTTLTTQAANRIINQTGIGHTIFNDKLVDGTRSLKVYGWTETQYLMAAKMLIDAGCKVNVRGLIRKWRNQKCTLQLRLHVSEQ